MIIPKELILKAKEFLGEKAAYIIAQDLKLDCWDDKELKACCFSHAENTASLIWNSKNNSFHCFGCNINYDIINHYITFHKLTHLEAVEKLFKETDIKYRFNEKGIKTDKDYRYPHREQFNGRTKVEEYLSLRGISKQTLDHTDTQEDHNGNIVFHFYDLHDVLTLVKYRPARKVTKKEDKSWCQQNSDTKPILFNMNRIDPTKPLLINEGEIDTLSAIEAGYLNSVSVPLGASNFSWIEENWDFLQQFEKIIVWSDNDEPGIKMRKEVGARLGTWRTYFVDLPKQVLDKDGNLQIVKDANDVLYYCGKQVVLDYINNAEEIPITGVSDLASVEDFDLEKAPGLYTGLKPIDDIVYKFLFGSVVLVTGIKGGGKSSIINQIFICESLDQGHDVFLYTAELSSPIAKNWIELSMAGPENVKMKDRFIHIINNDVKKRMREWYGGRVFVYDHISNKEQDILDRAINVVRKYGVKTLVLDNLMTIDIGANDTNVLQKQREFIVKLVSIAKQYGILIVLVSHPRKTLNGSQLTSDDISGAAELGNLAQNILSIHRYTDKEKKGERDGRGNIKKGREPIDYDVGVDVLKNRYTGRIGRANLYFDYTSYRFYSNPKELWKRYKWDFNNKNPLPTNDPNGHTPFD